MEEGHMGQHKLEEQGVAMHNKKFGRDAWGVADFIVKGYFQASEPQGHLAQKTFLEQGVEKMSIN